MSRQTELILLTAVLLLAALLRLGWPGLTEFKADEARLMALSLSLAEGGALPLRGISSSVGLPNFPMSVWLYALPLVVWPSVYAATLFTGLLNTLAVAASYWLVRRTWGVPAALATALLFAASPWAVLYSRKIWAQNLLPLFVVGWGIGALLAYVERRPRWLLLHLLCLAIAVQIHLGAASLGGATAVLLLIFWRRIDWRWLLAGLLLAGLTAVPFVFYLLTSGLPAELASGPNGRLAGAVDLVAVQQATLISTGSQIHSLAGPAAYRDYLARLPDMWLVHWLWGGLILAGAGWLGWQVIGGRREPARRLAAETAVVLLVWLIAPVLFYIYHVTPLFPHYFIVLYPAQYVAAGVGAAVLLGRLGRRAAGLGWGVLAASAGAQAAAWLVLLFFVAGRATPGGFGPPLARQLAIADRARALLVDYGAAEVLLAGPGDQPGQDAFPAVWDLLLRDTPHRLVDVRHAAVFPRATAVVLLNQEANGSSDSYLAAAEWRESMPLRPGEEALTLLVVTGSPAPDARFARPALLANWVQLIGYDELALAERGETAVWRIYWQTADNPDPAVYHFFNHLLDANGRRVAQADGPAFAPWQWQAGDLVVSRFELPWTAAPATPLLMRTGMYRYPSLENVPLLDVAANPYSDAIEIELTAP